MHMIALGWLWVVFMMAITEKSLVAGVMTFVFYGLVPTALLLYLLHRQSGKRIAYREWQRAREAAAQEAAAQEVAPQDPGKPGTESSRAG